MGTTNARVLPEPVAASTATSLKLHSRGIVAACTGVQKSNPDRLRASRTGSERRGSRSEKRVVVRARLRLPSRGSSSISRLGLRRCAVFAPSQGFGLGFLAFAVLAVQDFNLPRNCENRRVVVRRCVHALGPGPDQVHQMPNKFSTDFYQFHGLNAQKPNREVNFDVVARKNYQKKKNLNLLYFY